MREILFRGQRKDNGEWIEGYYVRLGEHHYILTGKLDITKGFPIFVHYEVLPETVGQYTGLTDKNGKKIFEGVIVSFNEYHYSIEWKKERCGFGFRETADRLLEIDGEHCEVIGNIHDCPELLKGKTNEVS